MHLRTHHNRRTILDRPGQPFQTPDYFLIEQLTFSVQSLYLIHDTPFDISHHCLANIGDSGYYRANATGLHALVGTHSHATAQ
jgi:hypothetical protein